MSAHRRDGSGSPLSRTAAGAAETTAEQDRRQLEVFTTRQDRDAALDLAAEAIRWLSSPGTPRRTADLRSWRERLQVLERRAGRR